MVYVYIYMYVCIHNFVYIAASCSSGHVVVSYDDRSDGESVVVSAKSWPSGEQQTTVFSGATFPTLECGETFVRCNLTAVLDINSEKVAVTIPLVQGVGLVLYEILNGSIRYQDHFLLEQLPSLNCHITQFFNSTGSTIGYCINVSTTTNENLKHVQLNINFTDLTQSTLSQIYNPSMFDLPQDTSQSVYFNERANCFEDDKNFVFIIDGLFVDRFDLMDGMLEFFGMFDVSSFPREEVDCVNPRRVKRVDDSVLAIYCTNLTIELDVCRLETDTVLVNTYDLDEGIVYNCTTDSRTFVLEKNGSLFLPSFPGNVTVPLPSDFQGIYTADCFIANEELFLVSTSFGGHTLSLSSQQQLFTTLGISDYLIPHVMYSGPSALFNSNGTTLLYNFSCPLSPVVVAIDHPFKLSTVIESGEGYSCMCFDPGTTEVPTENSTSTFTADTTKPEKAKNHTTQIVVPIIAGVVLIIAVLSGIIIIIIIMCVKRRNANRNLEALPIPVQATDHDDGTPQESSAKGLNKSSQGACFNHHGDYMDEYPLLEPAQPNNGDQKVSRSTTPVSVRPIQDTNKKNASRSLALPKKPVPTELVHDHKKNSEHTEPSND